VPGKIDGTIKVDDDIDGGGDSRNGEREEDAEDVEVSLTEEETSTGTRNDAGVWHSHGVSQNVR